MTESHNMPKSHRGSIKAYRRWGRNESKAAILRAVDKGRLWQKVRNILRALKADFREQVKDL